MARPIAEFGSVLIGVLFLLVMGAAACSTNAASPARSERKAAGQPQVEIVTPDGGRVVYTVEVARTEKERARGLMGRASLAEERGMIFIFPHEEVQSFWMKDTQLPLDMIFISSDLKVVGVIENARPFDTSPHYVPRPSLYVLEVNGGQAEKWGIAEGSLATFRNITER